MKLFVISVLAFLLMSLFGTDTEKKAVDCVLDIRGGEYFGEYFTTSLVDIDSVRISPTFRNLVPEDTSVAAAVAHLSIFHIRPSGKDVKEEYGAWFPFPRLFGVIGENTIYYHPFTDGSVRLHYLGKIQCKEEGALTLLKKAEKEDR